ncbi:hypothetical protein ACFOVU_18885 [Nocardiopsis sediminis]|uniref:Uncharacterized protein n=1 Tax=Nocardiopsis sediminis TaxID=1778267 RepID=A0ABV8FSX7_9ACTN
MTAETTPTGRSQNTGHRQRGAGASAASRPSPARFGEVLPGLTRPRARRRPLFGVLVELTSLAEQVRLETEEIRHTADQVRATADRLEAVRRTKPRRR